MLPRQYSYIWIDFLWKRISGDDQAFPRSPFLRKKVKPFSPCLSRMPARFDFNRNFRVAQNQIHFRSTRGPPEGYGEILSAVVTVRPAFLKDKMFKGTSVFLSARTQRWMVQKRGYDAGIKEIELGGFDEPPSFCPFPGSQ